MSTVFETRLIGNIGKDAEVKNMENGIVAINFPVAHNKNWKDKYLVFLRPRRLGSIVQFGKNKVRV